ncbi:MAG: DUF6174 domain-containing protein [Actinomycetota bacterium]
MDGFRIRGRDQLLQILLVAGTAIVVAAFGLFYAGGGTERVGSAGGSAGGVTGATSTLVAAPSVRSSGGDDDDRPVALLQVGATSAAGGDVAGDPDRTTLPSTGPAPTASSTTITDTKPPETATIPDPTAPSVTLPPISSPTITGPSITRPPTTTKPPSTTTPDSTVTTTTIPVTSLPISTMPPISEPWPTITLPIPDPGGDHNITPADLAAARARFAAQGYTSYGMTIQRSCFCPLEYVGPFDVVVRNGELVSAVTTDSDRRSVPLDARTLTVAGLFDSIEEGFNSYRMEVDFDKRTGVPTRISIDRIAALMDDETTTTVWNFTPHRS